MESDYRVHNWPLLPNQCICIFTKCFPADVDVIHHVKIRCKQIRFGFDNCLGFLGYLVGHIL